MTYVHSVSFRRTLVLITLILSCVACAPKVVKEVEPAPPPVQAVEEPKPAVSKPEPLDKAQLELASGIESYENGSYKSAAKQLQNALALGLKMQAEQASAHKYLAFMHCVGNRITACRDEFRKAIAADPSFDLTPAESGHPTWGPVFRKLKATGKPAVKPAAKPAQKQ